ncbi:hypothetical protein HNR06_000060 [Nocardiopsis arvandica]|uniref:Lipoprotein n=1 Tax=Nocardiopsis sinuspersici TaxID=501010 RepID=A0A7Y9X773_9ACTN|nr:hypothetical protein [Nocardiopsis sinuspersici]NYH50471.1 hypothetical protein [Nocardiopsis sinuspersici]
MSLARFRWAVVALALSLSACSFGAVPDTAGEEASPQEAAQEERPSSEASSPEAGPAEDALSYMEAVGAGISRETMEEGLVYAHPDHPAHGYLQQQADVLHANIVSGHLSEPDSVELRGEGIQICRSEGCTTFSDFTYVDGLLSDFQVNGNPVSENFYPGSASDSRDGVSVSVASSYYSFQSNAFMVIIDVETAPDTGASVTGSLHTGDNGTIADLDPFSGIVGQDYFAPGAAGQVVFQYQDARPPGEIEVFLSCAEGCSGEVGFTLPLG